MKIKKRSGVFETNSSSVHSLTLGEPTNEYVCEDIQLYFGQYGWEEDVLSTVEEKASYVFTSMVYFIDIGFDIYAEEGINFQDYWEAIKTSKHFTSLCDEFFEITGKYIMADDVNIDIEKENYMYVEDVVGYIDHQSIDLLQQYFNQEDYRGLVYLICNPNTYITTDNDNH